MTTTKPVDWAQAAPVIAGAPPCFDGGSSCALRAQRGSRNFSIGGHVLRRSSGLKCLRLGAGLQRRHRGDSEDSKALGPADVLRHGKGAVRELGIICCIAMSTSGSAP